MQLFYLPKFNPKNTTHTHTLDKMESNHIIKTLRKQTGDPLNLTDGKGHLLKAKIVDDDFKKCVFVVENYSFFKRKHPLIHLAVAPTKNNSRYEWFVEKASEIGITDITPVICKHSERKNINSERLKKTVVNAMKQSLNYYLPRIHPVTNLNSFLEQEHYSQRFIAHCHEGAVPSLFSSIKTKKNTLVLIGPEGDFSREEVTSSLQKGFISVSLGQARLRTETAAIAACHTVSLAYEHL